MSNSADNLSLPMGSLPPRKRAKTDEEKEQRRVERILRNRRAAHASREKKRRHVEHLEKYVLRLEENLYNLSNNQFTLLQNQSVLINRLNENGLATDDLVDVTAVEKVSRPDYLEMTTVSEAAPKVPLNACSVRKQSISNRKRSTVSTTKEIPSPSFEEELSSDEEDSIVHAFQSKKRRIETTTIPQQSDQQKNSQQQQQQLASYLSPPSSTSPSKFKLEEESILNQEYSNLFEEPSNTQSNTLKQSPSSLELFRHTESSNTIDPFMIKNEDVFSPDYYSNEIPFVKVPEITTTDDFSMVEDLVAFNNVHHPAAMIHLSF